MFIFVTSRFVIVYDAFMHLTTVDKRQKEFGEDTGRGRLEPFSATIALTSIAAGVIRYAFQS